MTSVQLDDVGKVYPDGFEAVRHVDATIDAGEFRVLLGPSGCGKSTLLRMIAGLEDATSGTIRLDGRRVNDDGPRARDVAMAFQEHALYPQMTVAENIGFPLRMAGIHRRDVAERVDEIAGLLRLTDVLGHKPSRLSGGQQQRVSLGRSLIRSPRLFLMDEPLSNLDAHLRIDARREIRRIQQRLGTTTVFVTHDQDEAMSLADRITVMADGRVVQTGTPTEVYRRPADIFVARFVGSPAMNLVVATVVDADTLRIGSNTIRLADRTARWTVNAGQQVAVGIRPESLRRNPNGAIVTSVESTESTGSEQIVHAIVDAPSVDLTPDGPAIGTRPNTTISAVADPHDAIGLWAPFTLDVDTSGIHLFDLETGRSLANPAPPGIDPSLRKMCARVSAGRLRSPTK